MEIKYVYEKTILGWNWHPVIDDQKLCYPHGTLRGVQQFIHEYIDEMQDYINSDENNGLGFYPCGYDSESLLQFQNDWAKRGVTVF